jgi:PAS domain S-box-containing protein
MAQHDNERRPRSSTPSGDHAAEVEAAERRARIAESRYEALLRATGEWSWTADAAGTLQSVMAIGHRVADGWQDAALGRSWMELLHLDDRAAVLAAWGQALAEEKPFTAVGRVRRADGVYRTVQLRGAPVCDAGGRVREWVGIGRDITERRQMRAEALARAGQLEATIEAMADPVIICDGEGHLLQANAAFRTLIATALDASYEQRPLAERMHLVDIRTPDGAPLPPEEWPVARVLRGETISNQSARDVVVRALDGREVLLSPAGAPVRDASGVITAGVVIYRDLTERLRLERRTREALDALLAMAEALVWAPEAEAEREPSAAPEASEAARRLAELTVDVLNCRYVSILALRPALNSTPAQDEMESLWLRGVAVAGLTPDQAREWWARYGDGVPAAVVADADQLARLVAGEEFVGQVRTPAYSGAAYGVRTLLWVPLRLGEQLVGVLAADYGNGHEPEAADRAMAGACGQLVALVVERERLLSERAEAQATALALREANRRLDEFLSVASHELRTPLTTIKANVQIAQRRANRLAEEATQQRLPNAADIEGIAALLARTGSAAERQNRLVSDLLDVSRIRAGMLEMRPEPLDLAAVVVDAVEEQRLTHPTRTITLAIPDHAVSVVADGERIGQVIANYLTNAVKYSAEHQPVAVRLEAVDRVARVSVRDRGAGIPAGEQEHIWERFHRVPGVQHVSGSGVGLGLGLFISRQIVERHGGEVGVVSTPGEGSEFWFTLPR